MASKVLKTHSTLIPEQLPKPLQLFHGITLDGQIKIPSLSGSSAQKHDKRGERREENSWEHIAAKFFFSCLCFCFLWKKWGKRRTDSFLLKGLLFGEHNISVQRFEAVVGIFRGFNE